MLNAETARAEDIRAEIARRQILLYRLAAVIGLSPGRLSLVLNEHMPLTPELARRIAAALNDDHEASR